MPINYRASCIATLVGNNFFTVTFYKKDGSVRTLNGRLGVTKHTKSGTTNDITGKYLCVYDVKNKGYRAVNVHRISKIKTKGTTTIYWPILEEG